MVTGLIVQAPFLVGACHKEQPRKPLPSGTTRTSHNQLKGRLDMASKEKKANPYAMLFDVFRTAADRNLQAQSQLWGNWTDYWQRSSNQSPTWLNPIKQLHDGWAEVMISLAKSQQEVIDNQFDTAIKSLETFSGRPILNGDVVAAATAAPPVSVEKELDEQVTRKGPQYFDAHKVEGAMNIAQRVAVITGAASGIGAAVARDLAMRGARAVILVDLNQEVEETAKAINEETQRDVAHTFVGDTSDPVFRAQVFDDVAASHGMVRICVPAAGITRDALSVQMDRETGKASVYPVDDFRKVTEVNLIAPIYWAIEMIARIAEDRRRRGVKRWEPSEEMEGAVVFLGSVSSQGNKGQISYAVAKAGLEGAAATLMKEAIFHGVRCGIIHPGFTDTPMARALGEEFLEKNVLPYTQLRRLIKPEEISDAVCFMISNSAVSGELWADAGWHPPA